MFDWKYKLISVLALCVFIVIWFFDIVDKKTVEGLILMYLTWLGINMTKSDKDVQTLKERVR
ncbi:MAG: hypothetical protein QXZ17_05630 [Nitrososphaerota archaeon]